MLTLASELTDWIGAIGGIFGIVGTIIAIRISLRANRIAEAANKVDLRLIVQIDKEYGGRPLDPSTWFVGLAIENKGLRDARITVIRAETSYGFGGHIFDASMIVGDAQGGPSLPVTLPPGHHCIAYFDERYKADDGTDKLRLAMYTRGIAWRYLDRFAVYASNELFELKSEAELDKIRPYYQPKAPIAEPALPEK